MTARLPLTPLTVIPDSDEEYEKKHPTGCLDQDFVFHQFGDQWYDPGQCHRKTCNRDATITEEKCPELEIPEGCQRFTHQCFAYDFPWCCDRVVCRGDDGYRSGDNDWNHYCEGYHQLRDLGEKWTERGECNLNTCLRDFEIHTQTCPKLEVPEGCSLTEPDLFSQKFPECCPRVVCPWDKAPESSSNTAQINLQRTAGRANNEDGRKGKVGDGGGAQDKDDTSTKTKNCGDVSQSKSDKVEKLVKSKSEPTNKARRRFRKTTPKLRHHTKRLIDSTMKKKAVSSTTVSSNVTAKDKTI